MAPLIPVGSSARRAALFARFGRAVAAGLGLRRLRVKLIRN